MPLQKITPEEILYKSIKVFRRRGYYRTKMSDLAKEVGLTKGTFYHHFESKEDVMRKALMASIQWFETSLFSIAFEPQLSSKEKLEKMSEKAFKAFTDNEGGCIFANTILETAHVEDTFIKEILRFFELWKQALMEVFKEKYSNDQLTDVVQQIIGDIEGSIIIMQLHKDNLYLKRALNRSIEML
ncbi:TetR/AcrR family transcriptional regulator [Marivirga sp. S37H4]|uniref:TetR/AcrR family transcriptional regulator n=1 Tax=Marivirga aurantiaca TaxID=2802615 RepID=A0A935CBV1_9BACT|nr:TetR/AcrR family transcriptional regulator [Marivirga aurantiaca]MBK6267355.1 TetR/AcrR family transcriptional regulator [Marivirga aurantiaca]